MHETAKYGAHGTMMTGIRENLRAQVGHFIAVHLAKRPGRPHVVQVFESTDEAINQQKIEVHITEQ